VYYEQELQQIITSLVIIFPLQAPVSVYAMNNILGDGRILYERLGRVRFSHNGSVYIVLGFVSLRCVLLCFDCCVGLTLRIYLQFYSSDKDVILIDLF